MTSDQDTSTDLATAVLQRFLESLASQGVEPALIDRLKGELAAPGPISRGALEAALFNEAPPL